MRTRTPRLAPATAHALGLLAALGAACSSQSTPTDAAPRDAFAPDVVATDASDIAAPPDAGACANTPTGVTLTEINTIPAAGTAPSVTAYHVVYPSTGGLMVHGQICVPASPGPHAVVAYNHGGFAGLGAAEWSARAGAAPNACYSLAAAGLIVTEAQYRGEADALGGALGTLQSAGQIEVCNGEVDDSLALLDLARRRCDAAPDRAGIFGVSHGGCITLRSLQRRPAGVRAGVAYVPPTDFADLYRYHTAHAPGGDAGADGCDPTAVHQGLVAVMNAAMGTPDTQPAQYALRSVARSTEAILPLPTMLLFGGVDCLVPLPQACELRAALAAAGTPLIDYHLDTSGTPIATPIAGCTGANFTAGPWPAATTFTGDRYFMVLDGQGHGFTGTPSSNVNGAAVVFLVAHLQ